MDTSRKNCLKFGVLGVELLAFKVGASLCILRELDFLLRPPVIYGQFAASGVGLDHFTIKGRFEIIKNLSGIHIIYASTHTSS